MKRKKNGGKREAPRRLLVSFNELSRSLSRIDSWFTRLSQVLARDKSSLGDGKEDLRYAVRKINQHFYAGTVPRFDG